MQRSLLPPSGESVTPAGMVQRFAYVSGEPQSAGENTNSLKETMSGTLLFGANRGPRPSADGLISVDGLVMAGHPWMAWLPCIVKAISQVQLNLSAFFAPIK